MATDLSDLIGLWPEGCTDQETYMNQLISVLNTKWLEVQSGSSRILTISQPIEPSQAQWESQWVIQTGYPLPIPSSAVLVWYNNATSKLAGIFGTAAGYPTVFRREHQYPIGSTISYQRASLATAQVINTSIGQNRAVLPFITLVMTQKFHLFMEFGMGVTCTVQCGVDFLVNNVKVGTSELGINPDGGISVITSSGYLRASHLMLNLIPGTYTIAGMFGLTNGAVGSLTIGGPNALGARNLFVRAIAAP